MKNIKRKTKPDWNKLTAEDLQKLEIAEAQQDQGSRVLPDDHRLRI